MLQPGDPLYVKGRSQSKCLLDINGRPMVQWVLDALNKAVSVESIVIVGFDHANGLTCAKPIVYLPDNGGMLDNLLAGAKYIAPKNAAATHVLGVSGDIPALTGEMVDWIIASVMAQPTDLCLTLVARVAMENRFPTSRRTYFKMRDLEFCAGDIHVVGLPLLLYGDTGPWRKLIVARKKPFRQAALIGFGTILRFLTGRLTLAETEQRVKTRLGITGRALVCPYPETGMDVDKPHQLAIIRDFLNRKSNTS